ncbi:hypothetical protein [Sphingomonas sp.]|uniref:hypothetical protein n=1 Tax=Sphingomonas sp. TaxID=28214 RepID=UPI0028A01B80|nr:hypothetical protein [Sphingomonas sp.]
MVAVYAPDAAFAGSVLPRDIFLTTNRTGLVGEFLYGQDLVQSRENSAVLGATPAIEALNGNPAPPVYGDHRVELGNGAGLQTNLTGMAAQTIMLVVNVSPSDAIDASNVPAFSHIFHGATIAETGRFNATPVLVDGALKLSCSPTGIGMITGAVINASQPYTAPRAIVTRIGGLAAGSKIAIDELKGGALVSHIDTATTGDRPAPTYGIVFGNSNTVAAGGAYQARLKHIAALIWSRYLSEDEVLASYLELRANLAGMNVRI